MNIIFPDFAMKCLDTIESQGYEAWFVGGCVRDSLICRDFFDIDITTNALPDTVENIFEKTIPTGKKHGTITVLIDGKPIEVTTYRSESSYDDSRHPNDVSFEKSIDADLSRRDFTINALAYNPKKNIVDLFGGLEDIKRQTIKTVGNPADRFNEDALRILRAFRFSSQLGYEIEDNTKKAALILSETVAKLSGERVLSEFKKLSQGKNPYIIDDLLKKKALTPFGIGKISSKPENFSELKSEYKPAFLMFLCEHNIQLIKSCLKADNKLIKQLEVLNGFTTLPIPSDKASLKKIFSIYSDYVELYMNFIKLMHPNEHIRISALSDEIFKNNEPYLIKHLAVSGDDLLAIGIQKSKIGETLRQLTLLVTEDPSLNSKEKLINTIK